MTGVPVESGIQAKLQLQLVKLDGGSVSIFDNEDKEVINSRDGRSGFISVILTGLEYNRKKTGIDLKSNYPIILQRYESGRITIKDVDSGWDMNVTSFGKNNAELFVSMFKKKGEI
jgi:putative photosynthetic complex assembly protein